MSTRTRSKGFVRRFAADQLKADLRREIHGGRLKPGEPILSDRRLAERYEISSFAVRTALNGLASEGLVERRARSGTFVADAAGPAHASPTPPARLVRAVFYQSVKGAHALSPGYARLVLEIERTLARHGWSMIFSTLREFSATSARIAPGGGSGESPLEAGRLAIGPVGRPFEERLAQEGIPYVLVDHRAEFTAADSVAMDERSALRQAVSRLAQLGHRRIAYVGGADPAGRPWPNSIRREAAWREAMQDIDLDAPAIWSILAASDQRGGRAALERFAALEPRPSAAVFFSGSPAVEFVSAAREAGLRLPQELSVIAFGSVEPERPGSLGELALLSPDAGSLGRNGAELLLRRIAQPEAPLREILVSVDLVDGPTLGPAPAG